MKKTEGNATILYVNQYYEKDLTTATVTLYYYLGGKMAAYKAGASVTYVHQDHLTGTSLTTNDSGTEIGAIKYAPFGAARSFSGALPTQKFTGQRLDDVGLYYYGARYYDPNLARFISADTIVPSFTNPQALNRYSYVLNNPLRYIDPTGHQNYNTTRRSFEGGGGGGLGGQYGGRGWAGNNTFVVRGSGYVRGGGWVGGSGNMSGGEKLKAVDVGSFTATELNIFPTSARTIGPVEKAVRIGTAGTVAAAPIVAGSDVVEKFDELSAPHSKENSTSHAEKKEIAKGPDPDKTPQPASAPTLDTRRPHYDADKIWTDEDLILEENYPVPIVETPVDDGGDGDGDSPGSNPGVPPGFPERWLIY